MKKRYELLDCSISLVRGNKKKAKRIHGQYESEGKMVEISPNIMIIKTNSNLLSSFIKIKRHSNWSITKSSFMEQNDMKGKMKIKGWKR